ncbi:MAG: HAD family phosphatase, partial [Myxococcales bacterium]|nr:HAD family phosphatase [Myxococcales bacterium]
VVAGYASVSPLPGVPETLERMRGDGARLAVVTSSFDRVARSWLQRTGLAHLVDAVVAKEHTERHKPDPTPFLHASDLLGVPPVHCLGVEDSTSGITAILAAGMTAWRIGGEDPRVPSFRDHRALLDAWMAQ